MLPRAWNESKLGPDGSIGVLDLFGVYSKMMNAWGKAAHDGLYESSFFEFVIAQSSSPRGELQLTALVNSHPV